MDDAGGAIGELPVDVGEVDVGLEPAVEDVGLVVESAADEADVGLDDSDAGTLTDADDAPTEESVTELGATVAFGLRLATLAFNWFTSSTRVCLRLLSFTLCTLSCTAASRSWAWSHWPWVIIC